MPYHLQLVPVRILSGHLHANPTYPYIEEPGNPRTSIREHKTIYSLWNEQEDPNQKLAWCTNTHAKCARKFDDIVAKIQLKEGDVWFLSLIQVKHKENKKLNVSDVLKGDRIEYDLSEYISSFNEIMDDEELACREGIPNDNIRFCIFSNKRIQTPAFFRSECTFQFNLRRHSSIDPITKILLPFDEECWKFQCQDLVASEHRRFLDGCYLYLEEANYYKINKHIQDSCGIDNANDIVNYVKDYFNNNFLHKQGLHKQVFEVELQKIHLSHFMPPLTQLIDLVDDHQVAWNQITSNHDLTIISKAPDIEGCLYGCLVQRINSLLKLDVDWNKIVVENKDLNSDVINRFVQHSKTKTLRYWISPPNTLKSLILELWKLGDLTLILKTNTEVNCFEKFIHLGRSYIIIDDVEKHSDEVSKSRLKIFTHLGEINNVLLRDKMLESIAVSLQGRKETTLKDLLRDDLELLKTFSSADTIGLMRKRTAYLKEDCLSDGNYFAFLVEDEKHPGNVNFTEPLVIGDNITIECRPNEIEQWTKTIKGSPSYQNYAIYRLRRTGQNFEVIEGDKEKLGNHLTDQFGDPIYVSQRNVLIPLIGKATPSSKGNYIGRYLRRATVSGDCFNIRSKAIFLLSGDVENIHPRIKLTEVKDMRDFEQCTSEEKIYFIEVDAEQRQNYWNKLSAIECAVFDVNVSKGKLEIKKYKNCGNLSSYISYDGGNFPEGEFLDEIKDNGVTVVTGEPGMGKSSLLKSLCRIYGIETYVLFYDLAYFQNFLNRNKNFLTNPIECVFKEIFRKGPHKHSNFLRVLRDKKKIVLVLDSFDEIIPSCEKQVLEFIRSIADAGIQTIIASRLKDCSLLMNQFNAYVVKLDPLVHSDEEYPRNWKLNPGVLAKVPLQFATNPLYLNFLQTLSDSAESLTNITRFKLYEKVIRMKIERRLQRIMTNAYEFAAKEIVMLFERLALVVMFGKEKIEEELKWECDTESFDCIKFGIITHFKNGYPVYAHFTFVEFLVAQWLIKAKQTRVYESAARNIYTNLMKNRKLYVLDILCEHLDVQNAILHKNISIVKEACEKTPSSFKDVDELGRDALHIAAICCRDTEQMELPSEILNIIVDCMQRYGFDMNKRDTIVEWEWTDYINFNILDAGLFYNNAIAVEQYLNRERRNVLENKHPPRIFPINYFEVIFKMAIWRSSIKAICDLLFLQHYENREFFKLYIACTKMTLDTEIPHSVGVESDTGLTSLHIACIYGNISMVSHLIESGSDLNVKDKFGCTALHYNMMRYSLYANGTEINEEKKGHQNKSITKLLLERGADVNSSDVFNRTPLLAAIKLENTDVLCLLLEENNNLNLQDILLTAIEENQVDHVKKLLLHGADPQHEGACGNIPFHIAVCHQDESMVKLFLDTGTEVNLQNVNGETALYIAVRQSLLEIVNLLLEKGADPNIRDAYGYAPLHEAMINMSEDIIKLLLEKGANVNLQRNNGEIALHTAVYRTEFNSIMLLLENGADTNLPNENGETPFHIAAKFADERILRLLLERGAHVNLQDAYNRTPLHHVIYGNRLDVVKLLSDNAADFDLLNEIGYASLQARAREKNDTTLQLRLSKKVKKGVHYMDDEMDLERTLYQDRVNIILLLLGKQAGTKLLQGKSAIAHIKTDNVVRLLLQEGADVNVPDENGEVVLYFALYARRSNAVKLLLENGANINVQNNLGDTPLHVAAAMITVSAIHLLLDKRASVNIQNVYGETALQIAVRGKWLDVIRSDIKISNDSEGLTRLLLEICNDIEVHNGDVETAVCDAVHKGCVDIARALLENGADANLQDRYGTTPLHDAVNKSDEKIVRLLLENGGNVNLQNADGETALHKAVAGSRIDIVKVLLENGANVNIKDKSGCTCFDLAANHEDIVRLLLK
ncbi:hypothetical protein Trydic_g19955 [Trypoxylus dichotomus]